MIYRFNTEPQTNKIYVVSEAYPNGAEQLYMCSWDEYRKRFITCSGKTVVCPAYYAEITPVSIQQ